MTIPAPECESLIGRRIAGKFVLRALIGQGATGKVFLADQVTLGRTVALKVLHPELACDADFARRFHDEALAASRLNHPNTVAVLDYGQTHDGLLYIVMEHLRGRTLTRLIRAEFPLPLDRLVTLFRQILAALEEAHAAGVVHADLKSDNIVVETLRSGGDMVKVVDFGLARLLESGRDADPLAPPDTAERRICGTPEYMAPEVIRGDDVAPSADLYGAAVVLYELLTGAPPFRGARPLEIVRQQLEDAASPPSQVRPELHLPRALDEVLERALAKDPAARYPDAAQLRAAVQAAAQGDAGGACARCGGRLPAGCRFCPECGRALARGGEVDHPGGPLPLVGRARELAALRRFLEGEGGGTLLLVGPAGFGKSRLAREAAAAAAAAGVKVYVAGADPTGLASPWYPVRALASAILELPAYCTGAALEDAVQTAGLPAGDAPALGRLLGRRVDADAGGSPVRRRDLLQAVRRLLAVPGRAGKAALVLEDVERYDRASIDLLRRLAADPAATRVRILLTGELCELGHFTGRARIALGELGEAELAEAADALSRRYPGAATAADLAALGGGVPAALQQVACWLAEEGHLTGAPAGIADLVAERITRLPRRAWVCLQAAAVAGLEVPLSTLAQVVAAELPAGEVDAAARRIDAGGFASLRDGALVFDQVMVRDVIYDGTPADVRRRLHAAYLAVLADAAAAPAVLGHHADLAGAPDGAVAHLLQAGADAALRFDPAAARALHGRAAEIARRALAEGEGEERRRRFVSAALVLADTLRQAGEAEGSAAVVKEALGVCRASGDRAAEAQCHRAHGLAALAEDDATTALQRFRQALAIAIPAGALELCVRLYLDVATAMLRGGSTGGAIAELEEGIDLVTAGDGASAAHGPRELWRLLVQLAGLHAGRGALARAFAAARDALRHAERADSPVGRSRAHALLARLYETEHDYHAAARHRDAAVVELQRLGDLRSTADLALGGSLPTAELMRTRFFARHRTAEPMAEADRASPLRSNVDE